LFVVVHETRRSDRLGGSVQTADQIQELYAGSYRRLVLQLYGVTGDLNEAQDAVQEAFIAALSSPRQFATKDNPGAWIRRVALNHARTRWRRRKNLDRILRLFRTAATSVPASSPDRVALISAMRSLPESQRVTLALYYLGDLSINEVAETLGLPTGTVKARLSRGRQALAVLLDDHVEERPASLANPIRQECPDVRPA
jgi:RNA polymerase sigma factor (sigma-70 family)